MSRNIAWTVIAAILGTPAAAAPPTFPSQLQWTWASDIAGCEAELTRGMVIRAREVSWYDGPERLTKLEGPKVWNSAKGPAKTYLATFVTATSPSMGRDSDRGKPYKMRYTLTGNRLYISDFGTLEAKQFVSDNRFVRCPKKSYR